MKNHPLVGFITQTTQFTLKALLFLAPLLVLPYTRNLIVNSKVLLIFLALLVVLLGFAIKTQLQKRWELAISPLTFPLLVFGITVMFSTFFTSRYPVEALLGLGGVYLAMVLIGIFGSSLVKGNHTRSVVTILGAAGSLLSISMILQWLGWGPARLINSISVFNLPNDLVFNLSGSSFVAVQVFALALVGIIGYALSRRNLSVLDLTMGLINVIGLGLGAWSLSPGQPAAVTLTPLAASWSVMLRSLESLPTALIGHGPAAYATTYTQFKPLWTNGQAFWQFNFNNGAETALTLAVTLGLLGLFAWLFFGVQIFKQLKHSSKESQPLLWLLASTFVIQLLLPTNLVVLAIQIALMVFWVAANQSHFSLLQFKTVRFQSYPAKLEFVKRLASKAKNSIFVRVSALVLVLIVIGLGYLVGRAYAAYHYMYRANEALQQANAIGVYENHRLAVQSNPYLDSLRREYALTNLQIAVALSNNAELTDEERQQVVQLVSQAVREGRAATLLDEDDVENWLVLAEIYRNLIGAADEAQNWAISSLANAVQVNPINPTIRLEIGQLAMAAGNPQDAVRFFSQAIELKPDLPAGYFQLGLAYRELGQLQNAQLAWQSALALLPPDSEDYASLSQELAALAAQLETEATAGETGDEDETEPETPNLTEQNVQQTGDAVINPGDDASLEGSQIETDN